MKIYLRKYIWEFLFAVVILFEIREFINKIGKNNHQIDFKKLKTIILIIFFFEMFRPHIVIRSRIERFLV